MYFELSAQVCGEYWILKGGGESCRLPLKVQAKRGPDITKFSVDLFDQCRVDFTCLVLLALHS